MLKFFNPNSKKWESITVPIDQSDLNVIKGMINTIELKKVDQVDFNELETLVKMLENQAVGDVTQLDLQKLETDINLKLEKMVVNIKNFATKQELKAIENVVDNLKQEVAALSGLQTEINSVKLKIAEIEESQKETLVELDKIGSKNNALSKDMTVVKNDIQYIQRQDYVGRRTFDREVNSLKEQVDDLANSEIISNAVTQDEFKDKTKSLEKHMDEGFEELKKSVSDGKAQVASAITQKGVATVPNSSFNMLAQNILKIEGGGGGATPGGSFKTNSIIENTTIVTDTFVEEFKREYLVDSKKIYWSHGMMLSMTAAKPFTKQSDFTVQHGMIGIKQIQNQNGELDINFWGSVPRKRPSNTGTNLLLEFIIINNGFLFGVTALLPVYYQGGIGSKKGDLYLGYTTDKELKVPNSYSLDWLLSFRQPNAPTNPNGWELEGHFKLKETFFHRIGVGPIKDAVVFVTGFTGGMRRE